MMRHLRWSIVFCLPLFCSCTDGEFADFLRSVPAEFLRPAPDAPPLVVQDRPEDTVRPTPDRAATVGVRVVNLSMQDATVTVRMQLADNTVRNTLIEAKRGATPLVIGPDFTDMIEIFGRRADGSLVGDRTLRFGQQFSDDTTVDYIVTPVIAPPADQPVPDPEPEPEPDPEPDDNGDDDGEDDEVVIGFFPDCNQNGTHDLDDINLGNSIDCNGNGIPDECEGEIDGGTCCFAIDIDQTVGPNNPETGAGEIDVPGGFDCYTFEGQSGQEIVFDALFSSPQSESFCATESLRFDWGCTGPNDEVVFGPIPFNVFGDPRATLPASGTYTILVDATTITTGTYSFRLRPPPEDPPDPTIQMFAISLGDVVSPGVPSEGAGMIESPGSLDIYNFSISGEGDVVYFDVRAGNFGLRWTCTDALAMNVFSNQTLDANNDPGAFLLIPGEYTCTVSSPFGGTGTYQLAILPNPAPQTFAINFDEPVSVDVPDAGAGQIGAVGEVDIYTFDTAVDDSDVYFDVDQMFNGLRWRCTDAGSVVLFEQPMNFDPGFVTIPQAGTVMCEVFSPGGLTGLQYGFEVISPVAPMFFEGIPFDTSISGTIDNPFAEHRYALTSSPTSVYFNALDGSGFDLEWELQDSSGGTVFGPEPIDPSFDPGVIGLDGNYTLIITTPFGQLGNYEFKVTIVPEPFLALLALDTVVDATYDQPGQEQVFFFTPPASGDVFFDAISTESSGLTWECLSVQGVPVFGEREFDPFDDPGRFAVAPGVDYGIIIRTVAGDLDNYQFQVLSEMPVQTTAINIGDPPIQDTLDNPLDERLYTFTVDADTRVFFDGLTSASFALRWSCTGDTQGQIFGNFNLTSDPGEFLLPADNYTIRIDTTSDATGFYSFQVRGPLLTEETLDINIGDTVSMDQPSAGAGQLGQFGAMDVFRFTANPGTVVYFDTITASSFNVRWKCTADANGQTIFSERSMLSSDPGQRTLAAGGGYTISVVSRTDAPTTYEFETRVSTDRCEDKRCAFEGTVAFDTTHATNDGPGDCPVTNDIWYEYVAACTGPITIDTCGSDYDTQLAVYEGCDCPPSELVGCNDNTCGSQSSVTVSATAGTCYTIRVGGVGAGGAGTLTIAGCFEEQ